MGGSRLKIGSRVQFTQSKYKNQFGVLKEITGDGKEAKFRLLMDSGDSIDVKRTAFKGVKVESGLNYALRPNRGEPIENIDSESEFELSESEYEDGDGSGEDIPSDSDSVSDDGHM